MTSASSPVGQPVGNKSLNDDPRSAKEMQPLGSKTVQASQRRFDANESMTPEQAREILRRLKEALQEEGIDTN